jgi:cyclic beta-1,2-glucan synthetase
LLILTESIEIPVNIPMSFKILLILIALIWCILLFLYYRLNHFRKKVHITIDTTGASDILGPKEWEQQMRDLATHHRQVKPMRYNFVLDDYNQIAYKKLNRIRNSIAEISTDIIVLIPAARWLFDNFQMMYREIKKVRTSGTSYEVLPILKKEYRGFPRVYIIAKKMVTLSQGHLNEENIAVMLNAYQKEIPLTDKELWVLPEMLGFCLLESIIEVAEDIIHIINVKSKADSFVREKLGVQGAADISPLLTGLEEDVKQNYSFHAHVIYLLKNMSVDELSIQRYIEYHFPAKGRQIKSSNIFLEEGKIESLHETKIRALIISLREINELDGEKFFDEYSYLEQVLSKDPDGVYANMDSEGRSMYREVIVKSSLKYKKNEVDVANACLELAVEGREDLYCSHHVGTYLLGKGYPILKAKILGKSLPNTLRNKRNIRGGIYFLAISLISVLLGWFVVFVMYRTERIQETYPYVIVLLVSFPLLIGIAMELINFIFTRRIKVKKIPSLDYLKEIPDSARTYVVMPVIVSSGEQGISYFDRLHKHYLANKQPNLYFALLVDYEDAPNKTMPKDEIIRKALVSRMQELNELYPSAHQRFSLLIRYRKWNQSENCYMGWERKRGKLEEFNNLLNGAKMEKTSFQELYCDPELLETFQYVITLDADTNLIRDNAAKLVGLIDHPLNRPVLDNEKKKVKEGYVIIQPSVRNHIVDRSGTRFAEIFGGQSGLAHYATVVSDIYQDIFNEGIYIGKGVYDVKAFHAILHNTIPENRVLSHDLLESCYARTAFSSTAKIMDNFPSSVLSYAKREHRWIRGDWQLFPWLFKGRDASGRALRPISRWKIFDNLRRSLVPLSKTLLIILNLAYMPTAFYLWFPLVFFIDLFNLIVLIVAITAQKIFRSKLALVYKSLFRELGIMLHRAFMEFVIMPYRAYMATDAMIRTLFRIYISKKNLLRWNTAETVDSSVANTQKGYFLSMWSSLVPAVILLGFLMIRDLPMIGLILYAAVILVWVIAYQFAYQVSQPIEKVDKAEKAEDRELLLETARRTWLFFKDFGTKENNWLCPDNYQKAHVEKISDKTSPTNIGLQFLAILSARDFGFETLSATVNSVENLMETVLQLPKWKGHLYNWYQVKTLEVLNPAYISTVDSGNFLGHLVALKNGLLEQIDRPIYPDCLLQELRNTLKRGSYIPPQTAEAGIAADKDWNSYGTIGELIEDLTDLWDDINSMDISSGGSNRKEKPNRRKELADHIELIVHEAADYKLKDMKISSHPTLNQLAQNENKNAKIMIERIKGICCKIDCILSNVDFRFLFNEKRMLFHIGYHVSSHTLDSGCYDLMASESSLTSFLAVARGEVPLKHWHKLGRPLTMVKGIPCFVSWSGTMFEYLMPNLVLREYEGSVYAETAKAAVLQHMNYAKETGIPWGISESQYYRFDLNSNYQYKAFGVPKLRLQPVRRNSLVVTPYATMLALEYAGEEGFFNLRRLIELGVYGEYGFYEAIDYNSPDSVAMTPYCIVRSFMAHHQGMNIVAIDNYLNQGIMRRRFHEEPIIKATEVLLEEKRQSHLISLAKRGYTIKIGKVLFRENVYSNRYVNSVSPKIPVTCYLSNNKYSLMITSDGDGFSSYQNMMLYRWRSDLYANTGNYIYIKDLSKGRLWSVTYHPTRLEPDEYQVIFSPHQAEFKRVDDDVATHTVVSLSPDQNMEIRKVSLTNNGKVERQFELTSYLEVVGDSHMAELSHPAFNKLFIESEYLDEQGIFLSKRRGSKSVGSPYIMHMVKTGAKLLKNAEHENDRLKFIGRNNTLENPDAVVHSISLSNHSGFCNDPIMSQRVKIALGPGETCCVSFITGVCQSKEEAIKISDELNIAYHIDDIFEKFRLQTDIELKYLEITRAQLNAFQDLVSPIYYPSYFYRGPQENIRRNFKNQSFLWRFGVSGDNPIMLLKIKSIEEAGILKDALKAYEYLRINRVVVDLIILSEAKHGYMQELDDLVNDFTSSLRIYDSNNDRPSLFMLHSYEMIPAEIDLLYTVARIVFSEQTGIYFREIKENMNEIVEE